MIRLAPLLVLATAAATAPSGCRAPRGVRLEVTRLDAGRPDQALLRCVVDGGRPPLAFAWTLGPGIRQFGGGVPTDEPTLLVSFDAAKVGAGRVVCAATDAAGRVVHATAALGALVVAKVLAPLKGPLTVEGLGFGTTRASDDVVWLVPRRGLAERADFGCKQALWSETKIVACLPPVGGRSGAREVRVESGGRLAIAPGPPIAVAAKP